MIARFLITLDASKPRKRVRAYAGPLLGSSEGGIQFLVSDNGVFSGHGRRNLQILLRRARAANSLCPGQEKRTMRKSEAEAGISGRAG